MVAPDVVPTFFLGNFEKIAYGCKTLIVGHQPKFIGTTPYCVLNKACQLFGFLNAHGLIRIVIVRRQMNSYQAA